MVSGFRDIARVARAAGVAVALFRQFFEMDGESVASCKISQ
jgi:hypothetical protein